MPVIKVYVYAEFPLLNGYKYIYICAHIYN